jgi:hypothetical protein
MQHLSNRGLTNSLPLKVLGFSYSSRPMAACCRHFIMNYMLVNNKSEFPWRPFSRFSGWGLLSDASTTAVLPHTSLNTTCVRLITNPKEGTTDASSFRRRIRPVSNVSNVSSYPPPHSLSLVSRSTIRMYLKRLSSTSTLYLCCFMPFGLELSFTDLHIPFHT